MSDASELKQGQSLFWLVYGQIAALLGAFSLLVFVSHFIDIGLKGVIREAFDGWVQHVRPLIGYPLHWLVSLLPEAWRFDVSPVAKDYFAVGIVLGFSMMRADHIIKAATPAEFLIDLLGNLIAWPGIVIAILSDLIDWRTQTSRWLKFVTVYVAPVIYLGLLFAANAWLV